MRRTPIDRIWLIPSSHDLRLVDSGGGAQPEKELRFVADVHDPLLVPPLFEDNAEFDWIVIDTPPAMTLCTRAALAASHFVIAPTIARAYAVDGLKMLIHTTRAMHGLVGGGSTIIGGIVTHWEENRPSTDHLQAIQTVLDSYGIPTLEPNVPVDRDIDKAQTRRVNFLGMARRPSRGASAYRELVEEVIKRVHDA